MSAPMLSSLVKDLAEILVQHGDMPVTLSCNGEAQILSGCIVFQDNANGRKLLTMLDKKSEDIVSALQEVNAKVAADIAIRKAAESE